MYRVLQSPYIYIYISMTLKLQTIFLAIYHKSITTRHALITTAATIPAATPANKHRTSQSDTNRNRRNQFQPTHLNNDNNNSNTTRRPKTPPRHDTNTSTTRNTPQNLAGPPNAGPRPQNPQPHNPASLGSMDACTQSPGASDAIHGPLLHHRN